MYKLLKSPRTGEVNTVQKTIDNLIICIPFIGDNTDYQEYLKWLAEGNTPEPADQDE